MFKFSTQAHAKIDRCGNLVFSATFDHDGRCETLRGYISKTGLYEDMKAAGATNAQIREARVQLRGVTKRSFAVR